jgi:hypothetical protein
VVRDGVALWTVAGAVMSTLSFVVSQAILAGGDADVSITDPGAFPALLGAMCWWARSAR